MESQTKMQEIDFCKFHGFGNDYLVFLSKDLPKDIANFAVKVCDRRFGIGSDGIAVLEELTEKAGYRCRIFNPDGSEASFSGNGTRSAAAYLYFKGLWVREELILETLSGTKNYRLLKREGKVFRFETELGQPSQIDNLNLRISGAVLNVDFLDVGNPVCVVFVQDFDSLDLRKIGSEIENHEIFPNKTNVVFVKVISEKEIEIRIWERGAGETYSSGTCSIAAAVAHLNRISQHGKVYVKTLGGTMETFWDENQKMRILGSAELVFCGKFLN